MHSKNFTEIVSFTTIYQQLSAKRLSSLPQKPLKKVFNSNKFEKIKPVLQSFCETKLFPLLLIQIVDQLTICLHGDCGLDHIRIAVGSTFKISISLLAHLNSVITIRICGKEEMKLQSGLSVCVSLSVCLDSIKALKL